MTPEEARRYVEILDLYEGDLEALVGETRADKPGLTSALNPHLHDMAHGVATVREKITADAENMTRMIAGMREEWIGQYLDHEGKWATICAYPTREEVAHHLDHGSWDAYTHTRITRRYVTEPEEA